ncbi:MAG: c-type cytochrome biogenesis protein CcsB [Bacteroidales bacterium]|nr:c-type cytochrome biogenesis protein CcsB [Bacteroidales bacterium]
MIRRNNFLFSSWFMGALFIIFAMSMAIATFIENDYGAAAARQLVYNAKWFELIFVLLAINFLGQIFRFRLYRPGKLTILIFHSAFILIIIGAGITRYFGFDGMLHLREGRAKNYVETDNNFLHLTVKDENGDMLYSDADKFIVTKLSSDRYEKEMEIDNTRYKVSFKDYIPNAIQTIVEDPNGDPVIRLSAGKGRQETKTFILSPGDTKDLDDLSLGYSEADSLDIRIGFRRDSFYISSDRKFTRLSMRTRASSSFPKNQKVVLQPMYIYDISGWRFVVQKMSASGVLKPVRSHPSKNTEIRDVLQFGLRYGDRQKDLYVKSGKNAAEPATFKHEGHKIKLDYKPKQVKIPFQVKLEEFILNRYPGSQTPSSYKSRVKVIDREKSTNKTFIIYMNNILKHRGYRFYQSSYDKDEKGSVLSVNHDPVGTGVTYSGYALLFLFVILSLFNRKSVFRKVHAGYWWSPMKKGAGILLVLLVYSATALSNSNNKLEIDKKMANEFGEILVQDQEGRTKPLFTLSNDVLRKVNRNNEYEGLNSMQVFLGMYYDFQNWKDEPLIKISNKRVRNVLGLNGKYASIDQLVDMQNNSYKLRQYVQEAYSKSSAQRNEFDKEVIKVDERVNICFMIISGDFLKIFPLRNDTEQWGKPQNAVQYVKSEDDSLFISNILGRFRQAATSGNLNQAKQCINSIKEYQRKYTRYELPSKQKVNAEIFYYKSGIFEKLFPFYAISGLILLILLMSGIIYGRKRSSLGFKVLIWIIGIGFAFHTAGFILRWYISGHAPMSNGYESMIFVSWVILLGGFLFVRRSKLTLAATSILASLTLMVAHLSFMDPEITNLVPVLKSYWLTLHVSVITGSYGFLGMAAILGLIVMILYALVSDNKHDRILDTIKDLTVINYKSMILGHYLLTIGTFLGAIWANEAWGRYWGWDPKETWSLITIIVYSFVIHSRHIPGFKSLFAFNGLSLFAFSSVLMTYFGVNYYLTGLHSYAGGEAVPIPAFVYISVILLLGLALYAYRNRNRKMHLAWKEQ